MANKSKAHAQARHALRRGLDRFHLDLTENDLLAIAGNCRNCWLSVVLNHQSLRVALKYTYFEGNWYPVVYDRNRKSIVTFLETDMLSVKEREIAEKHATSEEVVKFIEKMHSNGYRNRRLI